MKKSEFAKRVQKLPPYLFVEIDKMKEKAVSEGADIINLGVGDPDIPTPGIIRNQLKAAVDDAANHQYPMGKGKHVFRDGIRKFMSKRYSLDIDPSTQIQPLIGSKEGIAHFPLAFIDQGDIAVIPEPAYPVYNSGTIFAGGEPFFIPLLSENGFLPDWNSIPKDVLDKAKLIYINYPNNPTGTMATEDFFKKTVALAQDHNIIIVHDAAYNDLYFGEAPLSFLQIEGAMDVAIEFHSLSKPFSMTGWRIGWACGNEDLVEGLSKVKNNIDSGVFGAIQDAGIAALTNYKELSQDSCRIYKERADVFVHGLKDAGWIMESPEATFYVWASPPADSNSMVTVKKLLSEASVVCTPGSGFGPSGEGYVRFALTKNKDRLKEAITRIGNIKWQIR
ncbi:LL-diaminopimelate aminotransferase [Elusimicrobiota bacterium]